MTDETESATQQQAGRRPPRKKYERVLGSGVTMSVEMRNHALGRTFRALAEKVDNQLSLIARRRDYLPHWRNLEQLSEEQTKTLTDAIERLDVMLANEGIKPAFAGKPYKVDFVCTTPLTRRFIKCLLLSDKALTELHALWCADVIDEVDFRRQGNKLRARAHDFSRACDEAFRKLYKGGGSDTEGTGGDDDKSPEISDQGSEISDQGEVNEQEPAAAAPEPDQQSDQAS